ncbi:hypothetical protein ABIB80_004164 [Bradyrhizobium sp. i1.15.2]|uniref:DUF4145 domain-containing protein n=1 Tax=Bradyrhizobium sp. i1.15.2 TaxID=3156362 RepID=UPI003391264C
MKCSHCTIAFHDNWQVEYWMRGKQVLRADANTHWIYRSAICPSCGGRILEVTTAEDSTNPELPWRQIYPVGANRGPVPVEVPSTIAEDYTEACNVLPISAKASAALSRRCLQAILRAHGYKEKDLAKEIDKLLDEPDPKKALPQRLRETIDAIRNFGNFSAHPINDQTTLQVIDVEAHEAEWCLEVIEELFDHFYVGPAAAAAKKAALNAKLTAGGKPPAK